MRDNFWTDLAGRDIESGTSYSADTTFEPIPDGTEVLLKCSEIYWAKQLADNIIVAHWAVIEPDEYKGRQIKQKIRIGVAGKEDRAKRMLAAIDQICGGALRKAGVMPSDGDFKVNIVGGYVVAKLRVWEMDDEDTGEIRTGNWVASVSAPEIAPQANKAPGGSGFDDDVPF